MAAKSLCSIPDCGKPHKAKGYCNDHYRRLLKHGHPMGGGTSRGEPLRWLKQNVSHQADACLIWPYARNKAGYGNTWVKGDYVNAHRFMCVLAHGEPSAPNHEAAHSCGNGHLGCVNPRHLSWKTPAANQADRLEHGTHDRGERSRTAKLTAAQVKEIRHLKGTVSQRRLAEMFNVGRGAIEGIHQGTNWAWLD